MLPHGSAGHPQGDVSFERLGQELRVPLEQHGLARLASRLRGLRFAQRWLGVLLLERLCIWRQFRGRLDGVVCCSTSWIFDRFSSVVVYFVELLLHAQSASAPPREHKSPHCLAFRSKVVFQSPLLLLALAFRGRRGQPPAAVLALRLEPVLSSVMCREEVRPLELLP